MYLLNQLDPHYGSDRQSSLFGCFCFRAFLHLGPKHLPQGCDVFHVHNIPDFLVFAGLRLKWSGTRIILDIHDIVPELYESKFKPKGWSMFAAGLRLVLQRK